MEHLKSTAPQSYHRVQAVYEEELRRLEECKRMYESVQADAKTCKHILDAMDMAKRTNPGCDIEFQQGKVWVRQVFATAYIPESEDEDEETQAVDSDDTEDDTSSCQSSSGWVPSLFHKDHSSPLWYGYKRK